MNKKKILGKILQVVWYIWLGVLNICAVITQPLLFDTVFNSNGPNHHLPQWTVYYMISFVLMVVYSDYMLIEKATSKIPRPYLNQLLIFYTVVLIPLISFLVLNRLDGKLYFEGEPFALPLFIGGILYLGLVTFIKEKLKAKEKQIHQEDSLELD